MSTPRTVRDDQSENVTGESNIDEPLVADHRSPATIRATNFALITTLAAFIALCSILAAPIGPGGVPITLATFGVLLAGLILGPWRGATAAVLYIAVGLAGVPIFAGGKAGIAVLAGPSAGYLLAYPIGALVAGAWLAWAVRRNLRLRTLHAALAAAAGSLAIYAGGIPVMAIRAFDGNLLDAWLANWAFVPFDAIKAAAAAAIALAVLRAFPLISRR